MKQAVVIRHVAAEAAQENMGDFVREISETGERQAIYLAQQLRGKNFVPDCIVASDAVRAVQTAEVIKDQCGYNGEINADPELYDATEETWLEVLRNQDNSCNRIAMIGHNPAMEALTQLLVGKHHKMKPGTAAVIEIDSEDWRSISQNAGTKLLALIKPREG